MAGLVDRGFDWDESDMDDITAAIQRAKGKTRDAGGPN